MKVLVIWANGTIQEKDIENTSEALNHEVGGWLEHRQLLHGVHAWFNEEGKLLELPINKIATDLLIGMKVLHPSEHLVGSVCFTGLTADGDCADCPPLFITHVRLFLKENFR